MTNTTARIGRWAVGLLIAVSGPACGGVAEEQLALAARTVDEIRSGVLDMRIVFAPASAPRYEFTVRGPFEIGERQLDADLRYRQVVGAATAQVRFVALDGRAFVGSEGAVYELPATPTAPAVRAPTVLRDLAFDAWATEPRIVGGTAAAPVAVRSPVDEAAVLDAIARILDELRLREVAGPAYLDGLDESAVIRSVRGGTMTVGIGRDGLLRALVVHLRFGAGRSSGATRPYRAFADARLSFSVRIARPNEPVRIGLPGAGRPAA